MMHISIIGLLLVLVSLYGPNRGIGIPQNDEGAFPNNNQQVQTVGINDTENNEAPTVYENNTMTTHRKLGERPPSDPNEYTPSRSSCIAVHCPLIILLMIISCLCFIETTESNLSGL